MRAPERIRRVYLLAFEMGGLAKVGGLGEAVRQYAMGLARRGYDVTVFMPSHGRHLAPDRRMWPLDFRTCGERWGADGRAYPYCLGAELTSVDGVNVVVFKGLDAPTGLVFDRWEPYEAVEEKAALFARAVRAFAERFGLPDLVHANDWTTALAGVALKDLAELRGLAVPLLFTVHLSWDYSFPWHYASWAGLQDRPHPVWRVCCHRWELYSSVWDEGWGNVERFGMVEADAVSTVSHGYLEELLDRRGRWMAEKACVVYNSTDWRLEEVEGYVRSQGADPWKYVEMAVRHGNAEGWLDGGGALFLAVGRMTSQKGLDLAIRALDHAPSARLLVLGVPARDWGYEEHLRALVRERPGRVVLTTARLPADLYRALHYVAKALVMPSRWEPFGISAIEALAVGTPVVATRVGGLPEAVGPYGVLVEPDPRQIGEAMEGLASGRIGVPQRREAAGWVDSRFRLENTASMLEACYERARQFAYFRALS